MDVDAWCRLSDEPLRPWEWQTIAAMDLARLEAGGAQTEVGVDKTRTVVSFHDASGVASMMRGTFGAKRVTREKKQKSDG
jgi:hypothetical protein